MNALFQDIFEYHHQINKGLLEQLSDVKGQMSEDVLPLMSHVVCAHQIWVARILNLEAVGVHDFYDLPKLMAMDLDNYHKTLEIAERHHADEIIVYHNSKGEKYSNSIREILYHIANHSTHHRAQIIQTLRRNGFEPPITDYIFYKR